MNNLLVCEMIKMGNVTLLLLKILLKICSGLRTWEFKNLDNVLKLGYFPNVLHIFNRENENLFASNDSNMEYIRFNFFRSIIYISNLRAFLEYDVKIIYELSLEKYKCYWSWWNIWIVQLFILVENILK